MKKYGSYILISIILVGLFSPLAKVSAQPTPAPATTGQAAAAPVPCAGTDTATGQSTPAGCTPQSQSSTNGAFQDAIDSGCSYKPVTWFSGCILKVFYYTYFQVPSLILWVSAQFFNAMVDIGIDSAFTSSSGFIPAAWAVVRDISNIFFILVLLYVAIQTILGLSHDTKKVLVHVIIMALLINFSMFFTKVVIDSSNIVALIFYNKLDITATRPQDPAALKEKDISGQMWKTFDATQLMSPATITSLKTTTIQGKSVTEPNLPFSLTFGIMFIAGSIMLYAAYTFFIAAISFLGRLIELWMLIIFSPFAFMSWSIPKLASVENLGWESWLKRLLATSFMAPIFMFFMYLIFKLLPFISVFKRTETTMLGNILNILIPALIVLAMLKKATEFAEKGGGEFGAMFISGGKALLAIAGGLALGGAGIAMQATLGQASRLAANTKWAQDRERQGKFGGALIGSALKYGATSSFDVRKGVIGAGLAGVSAVTGINLGHTSRILTRDGGFDADRKRKVEDRIKRAQELSEVNEDEGPKQAVRNAEANLNALKNDPEAQRKMINLNEGDEHDEEANEKREEAKTALATANTNLAANPTDPNLIAAVKSAQASVTKMELASRSLGNLERDAAERQVEFTTAERTLKDAIALAGDNPGADPNVIEAKKKQEEAFAERERTRDNVKNRQGAIRDAGKDTHEAEIELKRAQSKVSGEERDRRNVYADKAVNTIFQKINFLNAGGESARNEASRKIRGGATSSGGGGGGGHGHNTNVSIGHISTPKSAPAPKAAAKGPAGPAAHP